MTTKEKIEKYLSEPLKVGDRIAVMGLGRQDRKSMGNTAVVKKIIDGIPYIEEYGRIRPVTEKYEKNTNMIGYNPIISDSYNIRSLSFGLETIIHTLFSKRVEYDINGSYIMQANFNPFVIIDGIKQYYQRPLVWDLNDKQLLIDSIYNRVDCGKILVRRREWDELEKLEKDGHELSFNDIIDGKQRIMAIYEFINNGFVDSNGMLFSEMSESCKSQFLNTQLISYSEIQNEVDDRVILEQFLKLNFCGRPQSQEHLDFVKSLIK